MNASLELEFFGERHASTLRTLRQDPPWKVIRGFPLDSGECLVHLNNVSGGIFGGDHLALTTTLHAGAHAQITTTGATRLYRPRSTSADAHLISTFHLGQNSMLEYLPDALIPFRGARALQRTAFSLDAGATLFYWETLAPGRTASGERFAYERLRIITEINVLGVPCVIDRLLLEPAAWPVDTPARFGASGYLVTFFAVQAGLSPAAATRLEACLRNHLPAEDYWGITTLPAHGIMVRGAVQSSSTIPATLQALWTAAKQHLLNSPATAPRKTY